MAHSTTSGTTGSAFAPRVSRTVHQPKIDRRASCKKDPSRPSAHASSLQGCTPEEPATTPPAPADTASDADAGIEGDPSDGGPSSTPIDTTFCAATKAVSSGTLCAITPSGLDSRTKDVSGLMANPYYGFGYHAVGIPTKYDPNKGLCIHFSGGQAAGSSAKCLQLVSSDRQRSLARR